MDPTIYGEASYGSEKSCKIHEYFIVDNCIHMADHKDILGNGQERQEAKETSLTKRVHRRARCRIRHALNAASSPTATNCGSPAHSTERENEVARSRSFGRPSEIVSWGVACVSCKRMLD
jgi:hypothetical protein